MNYSTKCTKSGYAVISPRLHETEISETLLLKKIPFLFINFGDWIIGFQSWMLCFIDNIQISPVSVTARSKAFVCGCLRAGISGSSPAGGMDVFFMCSWKSLRRADQSSRGVIPSVRCPMSLIVENQRGDLGPVEALEPWERYSNIALSSIEYIFFHFARFEILTAVLLMSEAFCGVTPCYWVSKSRLSEW